MLSVLIVAVLTANREITVSGVRIVKKSTSTVHMVDLRGLKVFLRRLQVKSSKMIIEFVHRVFTARFAHTIFLFHFVFRIIASPVNTVPRHKNSLRI